MTLEFLPEAAQGDAELTACYEEVQLGAGMRFHEEVQSATAGILLHPLLWRQRCGGCRQVNLPAFPCRLIHVLRGQRVRVRRSSARGALTRVVPPGSSAPPIGSMTLTLLICRECHAQPTNRLYRAAGAG